VEIASRRQSSYILLWSGQPDDNRKGLIRIDGYSRNNIGVGIDDKVTIRIVVVKKAEQVIVSPTEELNIVANVMLEKLLRNQSIYPWNLLMIFAPNY
jgi:cell division protein 48 (CDC48)-like